MLDFEREETARPKRQKSEVRQATALVGVRMPQKAYRDLERRSSLQKVTKAGYLLRLLGEPITSRHRRPAVDEQALADLLRQLWPIGNNLNQIARVANSTGEISTDLAIAIAEIRMAMSAVMEALGREPLS